jgi:predicted nucleotidyltransferase
MTSREENISFKIKNKIKQKDPFAVVILFGSHARGEANRNSDWDILILVNQDKITRLMEKEYREELFDVELEIGEPISTFVFSRKDWEKKHAATPFYHNIQSEGIYLK